jgi:catechol 2,3-dioxygenase-like lactoylglutathione lyase family enzyme
MTDDTQTPSAMTPPSLQHGLIAQSLEASLTVGDLPASVAWYSDVLGFAVEREYGREGKLFAVALRAGSVQLLLGQDDGSKGTDRVKGAGFSLQLTTTQNVDEIAAQIRARGGVLDSEPADIAGKRAFRLRDPDGFRLTISSPRAS